ncbi:MAG TPA: hypothetical protein VMU95_08335 [Trebonia sp.]|nr:hypothetical protein [Trebonia sp.]
MDHPQAMPRPSWPWAEVSLAILVRVRGIDVAACGGSPVIIDLTVQPAVPVLEPHPPPSRSVSHGVGG